jgi:signal transduction histidine kinase
VRKPAIAGLTLGVLFTLAAFRAFELGSGRAQTLTAASARVSNLAFILSEYMRESLAAGDSALRQLAVHSRRIGGPGAAAKDWAPSLASARAGLRNTGSISVVDATGTIRHSTQPLIVGQSRREEWAFRKLAAEPKDDLVVSNPYPTVVEPKTLVIPFARPLLAEDGAFQGIVVAAMIPSAMRGLFQTMDVGQGGAVWVFHPDGVVLFREPSDRDAIGESATSNPIFVAAKQSNGSGTIESAVRPGEPRLLTAFRSIAEPPMIVAVSLDRDEVLHDWRTQVVESGLFFGVLAMMMAGTLAALFRQMDQRSEAERALARTQQEEADRLRAANDRLEKALRMEQEFLMTVSHELRTPLTAIRGWARMLASGAVQGEQQAAAIQSIERNARAQTRLVEDLLDMARVDGGTLRLDIKEVSLPNVVREAVETMAPAADAKKIRVEAIIDDSFGITSGDPDRLQQIVWNLLSNAIKFTPNEGRVEVRLERAGKDAAIVVRDTGAGISPDFLPHVFDRFRQEDAGAKRRFGGLGLGLAIVKHLVDLHGGSVVVESDGQDHGSTFIVRLPLGLREPILNTNGHSSDRSGD